MLNVRAARLSAIDRVPSIYESDFARSGTSMSTKLWNGWPLLDIDINDDVKLKMVLKVRQGSKYGSYPGVLGG